MAPLTDLLKKDRPWVWSTECQEAFDEFQTKMASEPVLKLPNFDLPFDVVTDASDKAIGGVLVQEGHPIAESSMRPSSAIRLTRRRCWRSCIAFEFGEFTC